MLKWITDSNLAGNENLIHVEIKLDPAKLVNSVIALIVSKVQVMAALERGH